jgi:solute carrier family 29 (equilibrative nucleoside transporter) protein 4
MIGALSRAVLLLPILLLVSPSPSQPIISSGTLGWAVVFVALFGFTNGYFGSLPMIVFSRKVKDALHLELAGQPMLPCCRHCPS